MKIINLQAENIKKLTAIDITPTDSTIMISGSNGAGKSSILDCIVMALCGGRVIPEVPVKKGADKGKITMDLGEYTIIRSFTKDNSYLKIENKDGSNIKSPQKFLDDIVGNISFDPLDFLNNEKKKQRDILLQLLGVNVDELDTQEKEIRTNRTIVGRDRDKAEALYKGLEHFPNIKQTEEVSITDLSEKLQKAMEGNALYEQTKKANEDLKARAMEAQVKIKELEAFVQECKKTYQATNKRLTEEMSYVDTTDITAKMQEADATNAAIRANAAYQKAKNEFEETDNEYDSLTQQIEELTLKRASLLSSATMPVDNLSFDDGGLLYNGIPLDQASDGEKLMVSLGISMALNPTLRVLRIKNGSLLDKKNRAIIKDIVKEKGYQLWFESVGSDGKVGIVIEEGQIVSVDGEVVAPKPKRKEKENSGKPTASVSPIPSPEVVPSGDDW